VNNNENPIPGAFGDLGGTPAERLAAARESADQLERLVESIRSGELKATAVGLAAMEGAVLALRLVAGK
jgi:hypothetical protein